MGAETSLNEKCAVCGFVASMRPRHDGRGNAIGKSSGETFKVMLQ